MKKAIQSVVLMFGLLLSMSINAAAEQPRLITWDDLVPWSEPIPDPFADLQIEDKIELGLIADIRQQLANGFIEAGDANTEYAAELTKKLTDKGLDVDAFLAEDEVYREKVMAQGRELVTSLDGAVVKLPGYALPFELSGKLVRKFLLVPYVGACIHSPTPPPNQLVVVQLETPYAVDNIYEPIWIEGRLTAKQTTEELHLVDGSANIQTGYTMQGLKVTPYEE